MTHTGKMTVEKARRLRDEERGQQRMPLDDPHPGSRKQRELRFDPARPEQIAQAREVLTALERLQPGDGCVLTLWRAGQTRQQRVTLAESDD